MPRSRPRCARRFPRLPPAVLEAFRPELVGFHVGLPSADLPNRRRRPASGGHCLATAAAFFAITSTGWSRYHCGKIVFRSVSFGRSKVAM